jgi:hypothetical protein
MRGGTIGCSQRAMQRLQAAWAFSQLHRATTACTSTHLPPFPPHLDALILHTLVLSGPSPPALLAAEARTGIGKGAVRAVASAAALLPACAVLVWSVERPLGARQA